MPPIEYRPRPEPSVTAMQLTRLNEAEVCEWLVSLGYPRTTWGVTPTGLYLSWLAVSNRVDYGDYIKLGDKYRIPYGVRGYVFEATYEPVDASLQATKPKHIPGIGMYAD